MDIIFTDCWVGFYQGDDIYEGGPCPDVLITDVPTDISDPELFRYYLMSLCHGFCDHDKIEYKSRKVLKQLERVPVPISYRKDLENCTEEFIEVCYFDLMYWIDEYLD